MPTTTKQKSGTLFLHISEENKKYLMQSKEATGIKSMAQYVDIVFSALRENNIEKLKMFVPNISIN